MGLVSSRGEIQIKGSKVVDPDFRDQSAKHILISGDIHWETEYQYQRL